MGERDVLDGTGSFTGGQNAGVLADRITENQYAKGVNLTTKDGGLGPRPGFRQLSISVTTEGGVTEPDGTSRSYADIWKSGKFQGAKEYTAAEGEYIIAVISGVIFKVDPVRKQAEVLPVTREQQPDPFSGGIAPVDERLDQYCARHYMSDAGRFFVIFDYPDLPVIIEGGEARRSNPEATSVSGSPCPEIPASVLGAYNNSRLFITSAVHEFTAGDPVGSLAAPDAPITFKEIFVEAAEFLGQSFSLGSTNTNNPITAIGFIQIPDTGTGIGPLFIATKKSLYTFRSDLPRSTWEQTQFGSLLLFNSGIAGARAYTNLNSDLIYMGGDGQVRSLNSSRQEQQRWSNNPIDRELGDYVRFDDKELNELTVVASHRNKVYVTVNPFNMNAQDSAGCPVVDHAFRAMAVMELENVSALLRGSNPVWAGIWTGMYPVDFIVSDNELYIFAKDSRGKNELYVLDETTTYDTYADEKVPITSRVYTRQYAFQDPFMLKEEKNIQLSLSKLAGSVDLQVARKAQGASRFTDWSSWKYEAPVSVKKAESCIVPNLVPHDVREVYLGDPEDTECNEGSDDMSYFRKSQYVLTITAENWQMSEIKIIAEAQPDAMLREDECAPDDGKEWLKDCEEVSDWDIHFIAPNDQIQEVSCPV